MSTSNDPPDLAKLLADIKCATASIATDKDFQSSAIRKSLISATEELTAKLETPVETILRLTFQVQHLPLPSNHCCHQLKSLKGD